MIPAHLVEKIKGHYVDLSDLLQVKILLAKKSANSGGTSQTEPGLVWYEKREITKDEAGMLSWIQCFLCKSGGEIRQKITKFRCAP